LSTESILGDELLEDGEVRVGEVHIQVVAIGEGRAYTTGETAEAVVLGVSASVDLGDDSCFLKLLDATGSVVTDGYLTTCHFLGIVEQPGFFLVGDLRMLCEQLDSVRVGEFVEGDIGGGHLGLLYYSPTYYF
jgi:hypothetical protein